MNTEEVGLSQQLQQQTAVLSFFGTRHYGVVSSE